MTEDMRPAAFVSYPGQFGNPEDSNTYVSFAECSFSPSGIITPLSLWTSWLDKELSSGSWPQ